MWALSGDEVGVGIEECVDVGLAAGRGKDPAVINWACGERVIGTWYMYGWGHGALGWVGPWSTWMGQRPRSSLCLLGSRAYYFQGVLLLGLHLV